MSEHKIRQQNCSLGRFAVCSCEWRSGSGDAAYVRDEVKRHLWTVGTAS